MKADQLRLYPIVQLSLQKNGLYSKLEMDTSDELDELKINTFDKLDELLHTVETRDLTAFRRVNFNFNIDDNDTDIDGLAVRTSCLLNALPLQTLQPDGRERTSNRRRRERRGVLEQLRSIEDCHLGKISDPARQTVASVGVPRGAHRDEHGRTSHAVP